ncbi:MAG: hypothetical protein WCK67_07905 [bacterium]
MIFITPDSELFDYKTVKRLFDDNKNNLKAKYSFDFIIKNSHFFSVYEKTKLIGCIYLFKEENKLFITAFAGRKTHLENIKALNIIINQFYNCDIYAETEHKTAIYCILKAGFKKVNNNLYIKEKVHNA